MNKDLMEVEDSLQEEKSIEDILSENQIEKDIEKEEKKAKKIAKKEAKRAAKKVAESKSDDSVEDNQEAATLDEGSNNTKPKRKSKKKKSREATKPEDINIVKELLSLIVYIGIVVIACFLIINFVGCRSLVDGTSMEPTLHNGDNLWVDKLSYTLGDPERFDVIVFYYDEETTYIKRIIGLPGETVRIDQNGNIFINDMLLKEEPGKERILPQNIGRASQTILLGEDEYFVLGDNRNNSQDSRISSVGNVQREDILGKAIFRIYPLSDFGIVE